MGACSEKFEKGEEIETCKVELDGEPFIEVERGEKNTTLPVSPCQISIKDPESITHEVGHCVGAHLDEFGVPPGESPTLEKYSEYAERTYFEGDAGEGFAQSFSDYFERPNFLEEGSKELYDFWDGVVEESPKIEDMLEESKKCVGPNL